MDLVDATVTDTAGNSRVFVILHGADAALLGKCVKFTEGGLHLAGTIDKVHISDSYVELGYPAPTQPAGRGVVVIRAVDLPRTYSITVGGK